jgi:hypothetical protein
VRQCSMSRWRARCSIASLRPPLSRATVIPSGACEASAGASEAASADGGRSGWPSLCIPHSVLTAMPSAMAR